MRRHLMILVICCISLVIYAQDNRGVAIVGGQENESRIALVIGNGNYQSSPLSNPLNDATDMAKALTQCQFDVTRLVNASRQEMHNAIRTFGNRINTGNSIGLFYYAGYGMQVDGENYLVPIGAEVFSEDEVEDECLKVSSVLRKMESAGNRLNIIILDACRDTPFGRSFRSSQHGLARMDAPTGSIISYATAPGKDAADSPGRNSLFTSMFLKHLSTPGLEIGSLFRRVRADVLAASDERQVPWESSSLIGEFYFLPDRDVKIQPKPEETSHKRNAFDEMVWVEGGTFMMGSNEGDDHEKPVHLVHLDGFYMDKYEVTVSRFRAFCNATGHKMPVQPDWSNSNHPVVYVTWHDANAYAKWAGKRLPTEAEWEYASREGGKDVRFGNGRDIADPNEINFKGSSEYKESYSVSGVYRKRTTSVGSFAPNALGLYDMSGNVWEWCSDWYAENYYQNHPSRKPQGPSSGSLRVLRGSAWNSVPRDLRCASRGGINPGSRYDIIGFRCVRTL